MPREARYVAPGLLHHVTQRGNNHDSVFLCDQDRLDYLDRIRFYRERYGVSVFGFCLMGNHVHLVLRPERTDSLAGLLHRTHGEYAQQFNRRRGRSGHLWQNRYFSCPMERAYCWNALRYVDLNPVRAGLAPRPEQWRWSSAAAHIRRVPDEFQLLDMEWLDWWDWPDWEPFLQQSTSDEDRRLRDQTMRGRPLGSESFVRSCEQLSGRRFSPEPAGRPAMATADAAGN